MRQLKLRFAEPDEAKQIGEWLRANPDNLYDPGIWKYPTLQTVCSYSEYLVIGYLPMQRALVLESTAMNPDVGEADKAQAVRDFVKAATLLASSHGIREIYYFGKDAKLNEVAKAHGFEQLKQPVFRMKLQ